MDLAEHMQPTSTTDTDMSATLRRRRSGACRRRPLSAAQTRQIQVVYTDIFLDTFSYERDFEVLWNDLLGMNDDDDSERRVLLVLSNPVYNVVQRNENAIVLRDGRCFITTPSCFDRIGDENNPAPSTFDAIVYFNVDPFAAARPARADETRSMPTLSAVVPTPFAVTFDHYMTLPEVVHRPTTVSIVSNVFLLNETDVRAYERSRDLVVKFNTSVVPAHSYEKPVVASTSCNFCSDAVLCAAQDTMSVYTIRPDQHMPSLRSLGPAGAESLFQASRLVLLDISSPVGSATDEYYRLKQFYFSFAHGRKNKWGFALARDQPLRAYLERWNLAMREELRRWFWVLGREAEMLPPAVRPSESDRHQRIMQVYAMCPCILNAVDVEGDVCGGRTGAAMRQPPMEVVVHGENYVRDVLMSRYDTSSFAPGGDLNDRTILKSLAVQDISVNNMLVATGGGNIGMSQMKHNKFFQTMI